MPTSFPAGTRGVPPAIDVRIQRHDIHFSDVVWPCQNLAHADSISGTIADIECGHVPPYLPIVNGAFGRIVYTDNRKDLTQTLL